MRLLALLITAIFLGMSFTASNAMTLKCELTEIISHFRKNLYGTLDYSQFTSKKFTLTIENDKCAWGSGKFIYDAEITDRAIICTFKREEKNTKLETGVYHTDYRYIVEYLINRYSGEASKYKQETGEGTHDDGSPFHYNQLESAEYSCSKTSKKF
jgi:hypothetical protein